MSGSPSRLKIGDAVVDFAALSIEGPDGRRSVESKVMRVLQALVASAPGVVSRSDLIDTVWANESGGDESLSRAISLLRKAFGDERGKHAYIETIPRRGYRLLATLSAAVNDESADEAALESGMPSSVVPGPSAGKGREGRLAIALGLLAMLVVPLALFLRFGMAPEKDAAAPPPRSIAVLPFADMSGAGDQEYFADGLTEEILNALMRIPEIRVAGRTSSFAYRGRNLDLRRIGRDLGVGYVLEGSVRKQQDRVRVTAQLIRTDDGYHRWSESFDGDVGNIFELQENIAREVAGALEVVLEASAAARLAPRLTDNRAAYDAFLQGRNLSRRFGAEAKERAVRLLRLAVELDPDFADAWAALAQSSLFMSVTHPDRDATPYVREAKQAVERALTINPDLALAYYVQGLILEYEIDVAGALEAASRAYELAPNDPYLGNRYGRQLVLIGRTADGAALMEAAMRQDPTDAAGLMNLGVARAQLGETAEAERLLRRSYELGFVPVGFWLAHFLAQIGRLDEATQLWERLRTEYGNRFPPGFDSPEFWATTGRAVLHADPAARATVDAALRAYFAQPDSIPNSPRVGLFAFIGSADAFMQMFVERPYPVNGSLLFGLWDRSDASRHILASPGFPAFAERIGLLEAWQRYGWPAMCSPFPGSDGRGGQFSCAGEAEQTMSR